MHLETRTTKRHVFKKIFHFPLSVFVGITGEAKSRAVSSVGRASRLHREGREFESLTAHHKLK